MPPARGSFRHAAILEELSDEKEATIFLSRDSTESDISPAGFSPRWLDRNHADDRRKKPSRHDRTDVGQSLE